MYSVAIALAPPLLSCIVGLHTKWHYMNPATKVSEILGAPPPEKLDVSPSHILAWGCSASEEAWKDIASLMKLSRTSTS